MQTAEAAEEFTKELGGDQRKCPWNARDIEIIDWEERWNETTGLRILYSLWWLHWWPGTSIHPPPSFHGRFALISKCISHHKHRYNDSISRHLLISMSSRLFIIIPAFHVMFDSSRCLRRGHSKCLCLFYWFSLWWFLWEMWCMMINVNVQKAESTRNLTTSWGLSAKTFSGLF